MTESQIELVNINDVVNFSLHSAWQANIKLKRRKFVFLSSDNQYFPCSAINQWRVSKFCHRLAFCGAFYETVNLRKRKNLRKVDATKKKNKVIDPTQ